MVIYINITMYAWNNKLTHVLHVTVFSLHVETKLIAHVTFPLMYRNADIRFTIGSLMQSHAFELAQIEGIPFVEDKRKCK